jgi:hypothetical protein
MPSPFLPSSQVQFAWDSTSLGWLKECPRKYQYSMIEGWRGIHESVHLRFGLHYHSALEAYDRHRTEGLDHDSALNLVVHKTLLVTWGSEGPWAPDHPSKNRENLIRSIIWYCDHFADDSAATVILANGKPAVELSFKMELDWGPSSSQPYLLCGHLDRVVTFTGGTYVMDRKTTASTIGSSYFDQYDPDNQMSLYSLAAKVIYKTPVQGVIIDGVQVASGFSRFSRGFTYRTEAQLQEWLLDTRHWLALAEHYAARGHWPMNDKSCHHFGGCVFRKVCSKSPEFRDRFLESDFHRVPWNPLVPR